MELPEPLQIARNVIVLAILLGVCIFIVEVAVALALRMGLWILH